jgi:hypothetical protein
MNIIFKNPRIKYRKEDFGGILKTDKGIFMIDREVYDFLESFSQCYENELINKQIAKELLEINGLIKLNKEDALCIQKKQKK